MNKDKDNQEVSYHDGEPYEAELEKMKGSSSYDDNNKIVTTSQKNYSSGEVAMHECNLCGKTFKNGKALGGHRRSHFQAAKVKPHLSNHLKTISTNNNNNKKVVCDDNDGGDDSDNDGKHTCYLCKKDFPSNHSLYGHMRSHPERLWRGVCPPIHSNHLHDNNKHSSSSSSQSSDLEYDYDEVFAPAIDISKSSSLPRWQKTGKRGRKSTSVYEAAENLVLLSLRYNNFFAIGSTVVEPKSPQSPIISCKRKNIGEASTSGKHASKKIKFYISDSLKLGNQNDGCDSDKVNKGGGNLSELKNESVSENMDCKEEVEKDSGSMNIQEAMQDHNFDERKTMMMMKKKVKKLLVKKRKGRDSESEDKSFLCNETTQKKVNGYECDICWKSFPTFQGLGGHRSIHNKEKNNVMNMAESKPSDHAIADDAPLRGLLMEEAIDEVQTEEDASSSQFLGPKILDFDLNMPPDDMHG